MGDGRSLVNAALQLEPDLLVIDIGMPILNGIEATNMLREVGCACKVVFLTIQSDPDFVTACFAAGASAFVAKARMASDLLQAIEEVLARRTFISPTD